MLRGEKNIEPMDKLASIKKNTFYNTIKTLSTIVFPLITFPYISRVLHAEYVGKLNFGNSIVSYFTLIATLGITTYAVRECSKVRADKVQLSRIASQIFSINIITTIVSYMLLAFSLLFWAKLDGYEALIIIQSISIICTSIGADWLNTAMEDFRYITIRTFLFQLIALVSMFIFIHRPEHYIIYAAISLISSSGGNIVNIFYRKRYCSVRFTMRMDWKYHLKPILLLFAMMLSQTVNNNIDTTVLGLVKGDIAVGLYSAANKMYTVVNQVSASIVWVVMPQLTTGFAAKDYTQINKLLRYGAGFFIDFNLPCIIGIICLAPEILQFVAGDEYIPAAWCLRILSIGLGFSLLTGLYTNMILLSSGREKRALIACTVSALVNVILDFIFIPHFGINAAASTTAISQLIIFLICSRNIEKEICFGNIITLLKGPILGCLAEIMIIILCKTLISMEWVRLLVSVALSFIVYLSILLYTHNEFAEDTIIPVCKKIKERGK